MSNSSSDILHRKSSDFGYVTKAGNFLTGQPVHDDGVSNQPNHHRVVVLRVIHIDLHMPLGLNHIIMCRKVHKSWIKKSLRSLNYVWKELYD